MKITTKPADMPDTEHAEQLARFQAARDLPDDQIDLTDPDCPEVTNWTGAVRGPVAALRARPRT